MDRADNNGEEEIDEDGGDEDEINEYDDG